MSAEKNIKFLKELDFINPKNVFIARLPMGIRGKEELLRQLYIHLKLPEYFGFNWDALFECLQDFHWIKEKEISLLHQDLPLLEMGNLKTYLEILNEAANDWNDGEDHRFEIVFPENVLVEVESLIQ